MRHFESPLSKKTSFKLKKLSCFISDSWSYNNRLIDANFSEFLKSNRDTFTELRMEKISAIRSKENFMKTIFTDLKNLKKWSFDYEMLPFYFNNMEVPELDFSDDSDSDTDSETERKQNNFSAYLQFPTISNLKEIVVYQIPQEVLLSYDQTFLNKFPELEILRSDGYMVPSNWLPFLSRNNPKLKEFYVKSIDNEIDAESKFGFLKTFRVSSVRNFHIFMKFIQLNLTVEVLRIRLNNVNEMTEENFRFLMNLQSLRKLTFFGNFKMMKIYYNLFSNGGEFKLEFFKDLELEDVGVLFCFPKGSSARDSRWKLPKSDAGFEAQWIN